jgi:hypothetical protein
MILPVRPSIGVPGFRGAPPPARTDRPVRDTAELVDPEQVVILADPNGLDRDGMHGRSLA